MADAALDLILGPLRGRSRSNQWINGEVSTAESMNGECAEESGLHPRESADVDERARIGEHWTESFDLVGNRVVHILSCCCRLRFSTDDRVVMEIGMARGERSEKVVVDQVGRVGRSHDKVDLARGSTPTCQSRRSLRRTNEQFMDHRSVGRDACSRCNQHKIVRVWIGGKDEPLSCGTRDRNLVSDPAVAEPVARESKKEGVVGWIIRHLLVRMFSDEPLDGGRKDCAVTILAVRGTCNRVQAHLVRFAMRVESGGDDSKRLPRVKSACQGCARDIDTHMSNGARTLSLGADFRPDNPPNRWSMRRDQVHLDIW